MRRALPALLLLLARAPAAGAHDFAFTDVTVGLRADGTFAVEVACDLDALALGVDSSADSAALAAEIARLPPAAQEELVGRLGDLLKRRLRVRFDEQPVPFAVTLPERGIERPPEALPSALGLVARLTGAVPRGARSVGFFASRAFPPVRLMVVGPDGVRRLEEVLERGGTSRPIALREAAPPPWWSTARRFLVLGFTHILPAGLDHVLFVLGLALLSPRLGPLLAQVTAFTAAHTLTLGLAVHGVVSLPARVVEPLIAASIVYVAVENLLRREVGWLRLAVVFAFGLLHGLGFAGVLSELGWPEGRRLLALLSFNLGVEAGQVAVIVLALAVLQGATRAGVPRRRLERAVSLAIAAVGALWTVQRLV
jgi:hypothetical protein